MDLAVLEALNVARAARRPVATLTDLSSGAVMLWSEGQECPYPVKDLLLGLMRSGKGQVVETDGLRLFINPYLPAPRIVVIGAVHISQAMAPMARLIGYDLSIIDPRTAFASAERFDGVTLHADWPADVIPQAPLDAFTALAALTHDPKIDDWPISEALRLGCFYVGALGSRKTHAHRVERLRELGHDDEVIAGIHAPIGLDIGAASPEEIALATLAEIVSAFRRRSIMSLAGEP